MSIAEKSMGRTVDITTLPNHINNEHVHIFRWLDGCGWTIKCGNIHIESSNIEDAIMDFLKFTSEENGFHLIETLGPGISPISVIYQRDLSYEQLNRMVHEIHG